MGADVAAVPLVLGCSNGSPYTSDVLATEEAGPVGRRISTGGGSLAVDAQVSHGWRR
jgi:hypothetical protein